MKKRLRSSPTTVHHQDPPFFQEDDDDNSQPLIPGLPDHIAQLCLSHLPPSLLFSVCSSWRRLLSSPSFPPFLSLYALLSPTTTTTTDPITFLTYDPISSQWAPLPPPPINLLLRHPSFLSRTLSIQSLSLSGNLLLLAATGVDLLPALPLPLLFNPKTSSWSPTPPLPSPRRWCAAGTLSDSVFVASGIGSHFTDDTARSFHKLTFPGGENWESLGRLKDGRLSREAIDAVGCRGRLWMVNGASKQGAVYDVIGGGGWGEMTEAMVRGWRGPAAAMEEEDIYVVDEDKGGLSRWDWEVGEWVVVAVSTLLVGARQIVAVRGKVCAVVEGVGGVVVVDVRAVPARVWVVQTPIGYEAIAVHVLPRMCCQLRKRPM